MKYTFSRRSIFAIVVLAVGMIGTLRGLVIRHNLANANSSYENIQIKEGRYIDYNITKEQLIGSYYSENNGTIKFGPCCNENALTLAQTYIVAVNRDRNYYVPLVIPHEHQKEFKEMINGDNSYPLFGKFVRSDDVLYYDQITRCTGIDSKSEIDQMISTQYRIELVDPKHEKRELYKGLLLLAVGTGSFYVSFFIPKK